MVSHVQAEFNDSALRRYFFPRLLHFWLRVGGSMGGGLTVVAIIFMVLRDPRKSDKTKAGGDSGAQQARRQEFIISL